MDEQAIARELERIDTTLRRLAALGLTRADVRRRIDVWLDHRLIAMALVHEGAMTHQDDIATIAEWGPGG